MPSPRRVTRRSNNHLPLTPEAFERLYEAAPDAMIVVDRKGRILHANSQSEAMFGYRPSEMAGCSVEELLPESLREEHKARREGFFQSPGVRRMGLGLNLSGRRKDGTQFPVDIMLSPLEVKPGQTAVLAVVRDITEQRRAENALRQSMVIFERIFENAPDAMVEVDPSGKIIRVNSQTAEMFGYKREELVGMPLDVLLPERFRERHQLYRKQYFEAPRLRPMGAGLQLFGRKKDGTEFPVDIMLSPLQSENGADMALAVVRDITVRAQLAEQENMRRALEQKETLIREIHHRVKNNLQVISSLLSLQVDQLGTWAEEKLRDTQTRIRSIALIHEKLSRAEGLARLDFRAYLKDLVQDLGSSYMKEGDRIDLRLDADPTSFSLDTAIPCGLIVVELVSNALKYAFPDHREGVVWVTFKVDKDHYHLRVSDNGKGLDDKLLMEKPTTLGLQLVHALTEQLGGQLKIEQGEGTSIDMKFSPRGA